MSKQRQPSSIVHDYVKGRYSRYVLTYHIHISAVELFANNVTLNTLR